jgi:hypothetical protein
VSVPAVEQAAGRRPRGRGLRVAVGSRPAERGLPGVGEHPHHRLDPGGTGVVRTDPEDPQRGDQILQRAAHLGAGRVGEGLRGEQPAQHGHDRRVRVQVRGGQGGDEVVGRVVADEADGQPPSDAPGRGRVPGEPAEIGEHDLVAVPGVRVGVAEAEHPDEAGPVPVRAVDELPGPLVDRQAGQDARRGEHVVLPESGVEADGVQLEQLPAVVLVRVRGGGGRGVQEPQHRRVRADRDQQVGEPAEGVRADRGGVVVRPAVPHVRRRAGDAEVVGPLLDHDLQQLAAAPRRPDDGGLDHPAHRLADRQPPGVHLLAHDTDRQVQAG